MYVTIANSYIYNDKLLFTRFSYVARYIHMYVLTLNIHTITNYSITIQFISNITGALITTNSVVTVVITRR